MIDKLNGWKTYIGMILMGIMGILYAQGLIGPEGWISSELGATIGTIIATWTGVSMRHAQSKAIDAAKTGQQNEPKG
jgi:hypothetical protein